MRSAVVAFVVAAALTAACAAVPAGSPNVAAGPTGTGTPADPSTPATTAPSSSASIHATAPAPSLATRSLPGGSIVTGVPVDLVHSTTRLSVDTTGSDATAAPVLILETLDSIAVFDIRSGSITSHVARPDVPQINDVEVTADSIWVTDHDNAAVLRLHPETGKTLARVELDGRAVSLTETDEGVWAGSGHVFPESVSLIDPQSDAIARELEVGAYPTYALGSLWFGRNELRMGAAVRRIDPVTGEVVASIKMAPGQQGCYVAGSFPDVVWSWCLEYWDDTDPVRLDLAANTTVGTVELGSGGGLMGVSSDFSWFEADYGKDDESDHPLRLIRVDNATNAIDRVYENALIVAMGHESLWTVNRETGELRRIPLGEL